MRTMGRSFRFRDATIMIQGWYQGGISMFDFTDAAHPVEIAYFDRGPVDPSKMVVGGDWSAYWYNGYVYGSEIAARAGRVQADAEQMADAERN